MIPPRSHARGHERTQARVEERNERARQDLRERLGPDDEEPSEELVCPGCRKVFLQGSSCLECDMPLVGASMVDTWEPPAKDRSGLVIGIIAVALVGGLVLGPMALAWVGL